MCVVWWSGEKKDKRGGVGILLRQDLAKDVVEVERMSLRVMRIKKILDRKVCHILCTTRTSEEEKAEFEEYWSTALKGFRRQIY